MKSKYFQRTGLSDMRKKQLITLAKIPVDALEQIFAWLEGKEIYPRFDDKDIIELSELTGRSGDEITDILPVIRQFLQLIHLEQEDASDLYDDIKELGIIDKEIGFSSLDFVFSRLPSTAEQFAPLARKRFTENFGAPSLESSSLSVAIKPVYLRGFDYEKDSIEKYKPKVINYCIVVQIEILSSGSSDTFTFQCNSDNFDRFISDLLAKQAEMAQMEKVVERMKTELKR